MQAMPLDILKQCMKGEHTTHHNPCSSNDVRSDMFIESNYMRYGHYVLGKWLKPGMYRHGRLAYIFAQKGTWFPEYGCQCNNSDSK